MYVCDAQFEDLEPDLAPIAITHIQFLPRSEKLPQRNC